MLTDIINKFYEKKSVVFPEEILNKLGGIRLRPNDNYSMKEKTGGDLSFSTLNKGGPLIAFEAGKGLYKVVPCTGEVTRNSLYANGLHLLFPNINKDDRNVINFKNVRKPAILKQIQQNGKTEFILVETGEIGYHGELIQELTQDLLERAFTAMKEIDPKTSDEIINDIIKQGFETLSKKNPDASAEKIIDYIISKYKEKIKTKSQEKKTQTIQTQTTQIGAEAADNTNHASMSVPDRTTTEDTTNTERRYTLNDINSAVEAYKIENEELRNEIEKLRGQVQMYKNLLAKQQSIQSNVEKNF